MRFATVVLAIAIALMPLRASAGECDDDNARRNVVALETYASGKGAKPEIWGLCVEQAIVGSPKLTARFVAACEKIVARDPDDSECVHWSVFLGARKLGAVDLLDSVTRLFTLDPFAEAMNAIDMYVKLDDARALPLIHDRWLVAAKDKHASSMKSEWVYRWAKWRHAAIALYASKGTPDDVAFLQDQAKATRDRGVKRAIARAVAAIQQRAAATP